MMKFSQFGFLLRRSSFLKFPGGVVRTDDWISGEMLKKAQDTGCSKTLRYKAPEIPRSESYSPVRRNDEG